MMQIRRSTAAGSALVLAVTLLHASGVQARQRDFTAEAVDRATETIALGATGSLELKNVSGDITVTAGTSRDATVEIVRRSRGASDADARMGLDRVRANVQRAGDHATVSVTYPQVPGRAPYSVNVAYVVSAPAGTRITAGSVSGNVSVTDIKGEVSAKVVSGDVTIRGAKSVSEARTISGNVTVEDASSDATLALGTISGWVHANRVHARRIEADTISGEVLVRDAVCDSAEVKSVSGTAEYTGTIARGGRYEVTSHSGNIHIVAGGPAGFELQATTFSGGIKTDPKLDVRGATVTRRSVRGTVGDGSAVVVANAFSGDVNIERK